MLDDVKSPLNYSPAYSDTPNSSPDTRFDSPISDVRGSGGDSPVRDPRRRMHVRPPAQPPSSYSRSSSDDSPPICGYRSLPFKMAAITQGQSSAARVREFKSHLPVNLKNPLDNEAQMPQDERYNETIALFLMSSLSYSNSCSRTRVYLFPPKKRPCLSSESLKRDHVSNNETLRVMKNVQIQRILFEHSYTHALPQLHKEVRVTGNTNRNTHDRLAEPPPENAISRSLLTFTGRVPPAPTPQVQAPVSQVQAPTPQVQVPVSKVQAPVPQVQVPVSQIQEPVFQVQAPVPATRDTAATDEKLSVVELDFDSACETDSSSSSSVASILDLETDSEGQDSPALILSIPLSISRTTIRPDEMEQLRKPASPQETSETDEKERERATSLSLDSPTSSGGDGFHLTIESDEEEETLRDGSNNLSNNLDNHLRSSSYSKVNGSMITVNLHVFSYV